MSTQDQSRFDVLANRPVRRILAGTSLSDEDGAVLVAAVALARTTGAKLFVVHAAEPAADALLAMPPGSLAELRSRLTAMVREVVTPAQVPFQVEVGRGPAHRVLDEQARRVSPDLIVVGATARGGGVLLGSTAERLVRKATVPVLVVRGTLAVPPLRVVAPVDLSELSACGFHCGLDMVSRLAGGRPVRVLALFAVGYLDPLAHEMRGSGWSVDEMQAAARGRLAAFVDAHRPEVPLDVERQVVMGPAREEIVGKAKEQSADLVVMSTHGHGGFEKLVLGSVASTVVREAPCSVLLVPPDAAFGDAIAAAVLEQTAPCKTADVV